MYIHICVTYVLTKKRHALMKRKRVIDENESSRDIRRSKNGTLREYKINKKTGKPLSQPVCEPCYTDKTPRKIAQAHYKDADGKITLCGPCAKEANVWAHANKECDEPGCNKGAVGTSNFCSTHGGGKRCQKDGCKSSAQGKTDFCSAHGGGKRCQEDGCNSGAQGTSDKCIKHGGGNKMPRRWLQ